MAPSTDMGGPDMALSTDMGGLDMAPQSPQRSERPGEAGALLNYSDALPGQRRAGG